jgi:hypothetical protein
MDSATATETVPVPALDTKTLLARVNQRITLLRSWLSHDHTDEPYWWARRITAPRAQAERSVLRQVANLLHVERATQRERLHGTRFANLDEQRAWIASWEQRSCRAAAEYAQVPTNATLVLLRTGALPL